MINIPLRYNPFEFCRPATERNQARVAEKVGKKEIQFGLNRRTRQDCRKVQVTRTVDSGHRDSSGKLSTVTRTVTVYRGPRSPKEN